MPSPTRSRTACYAGALGAVALATAVRLALNPVLGDQYPMVVYFLALTFAAWYGGLGPSLLAVALSAALVPFFLTTSGRYAVPGLANRVGFVMYVVTGVAIAFMGGSMRVSQRRAEEGVRQAEQERERLEREVRERRRAEVAERSQRERLDATLAGVGDGVIVTDARGRVVSLNPVAEALTGWTTADAEGRSLKEVFRIRDVATQLTDELPVVEVIQEGVAHQPESTELVSRDGTSRAIEHCTSPIKDDRGWVTGVVIVVRDVTERKKAEEALRASEGRFRLLVEAMPQIAWITRPDRSVEYMNRRWFDFTGMAPEALDVPGGWQSALHPDDVDRVESASVRANAAGAPFEAEYRLRDYNGAYRWFLGRSVAVRDGSGQVVRRFGTATDIDGRKRTEQIARFLAEVGATLAALVDEESALRRVARLAVPHFADWCVVDVIGDGGTLRRTAVANADPARLELVQELHRQFPPDPDTPSGPGRVVRTGEPEIVSEIPDAPPPGGNGGPGPRGLELELRSYLCVPMTGRSGTLGAISFVAAESGRRYGPDDLRLAEDIARRAAVAVENARLYAALADADRRKSEFLAMLAHELRNPLAPIRHAARLLAAAPGVGDEAREEIEMVERQVVHLARLVDDLLDVSRISQGKIGLRKEAVELCQAVRRAVDAVRASADERGHTLSTSLPDEPIRLEADPTRLEQIVWNLLSNAVKYTEPGGHIALAVERDGPVATVRVRDDGIGIDAEMLPKVFDLFVQVEPGTDRTQGGLGVGLSLVKSLVELHGGTISVRSKGRGLGSEFAVRLPITEGLNAAAAAAPEPARGDVPASDAPPPRRRVLVVDDNRDAASTLNRLLTRIYGQEVRVAHDGRAALDAAGEFRPEVVLLDIGLPDLDGYEVARRLRARTDLPRPYIAALTGWGQEADRQRSRDAGFDRHLVKPVDPDILRDLLSAAETVASTP